MMAGSGERCAHVHAPRVAGEARFQRVVHERQVPLPPLVVEAHQLVTSLTVVPPVVRVDDTPLRPETNPPCGVKASSFGNRTTVR